MRANIVISPSQQTYNKCAMGDSEADHTRLIGERVVEQLQNYECNVFLVPKLDGTESSILNKVVNSSNFFVRTHPADFSYHLDIHTDAGYNGLGSSGFYYSEGGKAFIQKIHKEISNITPWSDSLCYLRDLYVLRMTDAIAGLIEISFHDRPNEAKWMHENINIISDAIVMGIVRGTDISKKPDTKKSFIQIIQENSDGSADAWIDGINSAVEIARLESNFGVLEIFQHLPALIEKIGNKK